jgi:endonuclease/exonuclease/phosphatase family metal-dependent hydrolase
MDRRTSVERIVRVLAGVDADIVALQEVLSSEQGKAGQLESLAAELGLNAVFGRTRTLQAHGYGNAILSRWPILAYENLNISWKRREPRGCLKADIKTPRGVLHVLNIHLGTSFFERRHQVRALLSLKHFTESAAGPRVLVGDFNEWTRGLPSRMLAAKFESLNLETHIRKKRSYPGFLPVLHLDHIYFEKPLSIQSAELIRTRLSKVASDHLPLAALFGWGEGE